MRAWRILAAPSTPYSATLSLYKALCLLRYSSPYSATLSLSLYKSRSSTTMSVAKMMTTVFFAVVAIWTAGTEAAAAAADCSSLVMNMADCLSFVTSGSTVNTPEGTCCSGLKTVLKSDAQCLCDAFKNSAQLGVTLNVSKALSLPSACHVAAPSVNNCGLSLVSGAAPAIAPVAGAAASPSTSAAAAAVPASVAGGNEVAAPAPSPGVTGSAAGLALSVSLLMAVVAASSFSVV